jgi:hypothetical protein
MTDELVGLRQQEYDAHQRVTRLRQQEFGGGGDADTELGDLAEAEKTLADIRGRRRVLQAAQAGHGHVLDTTRPNALLGADSTGLDAVVTLRMSHVPTAICHLLNAATQPLVSCRVQQASRAEADTIRRVRVTCRIEGYSAPAIDTVELTDRRPRDFDLLPTLFPADVAAVTELTSATVSALVEDLDTEKVEVHRTSRIWLLARTTAPLWLHDPSTGALVDLTPYLGAFVTPNTPEIMSFLRTVVDKHPEGRLDGYQGSSEVVEPQVQALYEALKDTGITYINSVIAFDPQEGTSSQRLRLPRESLRDRAANCLDGTVLVASLLEAMSLNPAIVLVPGHAFAAWETWPDSGEWRYLETTMIGSHDYDAARRRGDQLARTYEQRSQQAGDESLFRQWALRDLRAVQGITPME